MSRVMYDGKRLIPAPLVTISKNYQKSGNGDIIGKLYNLSITGALVAHMGSPTSSGVFWTAGGYPENESIVSDARLGAVMRKQESIRNLFSIEGKAFEIQSADGSQPIKCYPRITSIEFPEDTWYDRCNYTINIECDELYGLVQEAGDNFTTYIDSASESWSISTNDEPQAIGASATYGLGHTVSAVGKKFYDETGAQPKQPWEYAQQFVLDRLGFDSVVATSSGVHNLPSYYRGWNHVRSSEMDKQAGSYSVTENWLMASGNAIETFTINTTSELESPYNRVSLQGNVTGFEELNSDMGISVTKWANAQDKFTFASGVAFIRAQTYSGETLNVQPLSMTIGKNPLAGVIDYTMEYDSRPMSLIEGSVSESISINDNIGGEMFASIFVLGRDLGPVLQDLNTKPSNTRALSIEIVVQPPSYSDRTITTMQKLINDDTPINNPLFSGDINNLIEAADPSNNGFSTVFQDQPQQSWDFINGRFSYNCTWTYE